MAEAHHTIRIDFKGKSAGTSVLLGEVFACMNMKKTEEMNQRKRLMALKYANKWKKPLDHVYKRLPYLVPTPLVPWHSQHEDFLEYHHQAKRQELYHDDFGPVFDFVDAYQRVCKKYENNPLPSSIANHIWHFTE